MHTHTHTQFIIGEVRDTWAHGKVKKKMLLKGAIVNIIWKYKDCDNEQRYNTE